MTSYEHKIIFADSKIMPEIPAKSVHLAVTSPPYWNLKDYGGKQIGFKQAYEKYLGDLEQTIAELARVIEKWRFICINVGTAVSHAGMKSIPADIIHLAEKYELLFRKEIIWQKPKGVQGLWQRGTTQFLKETPYPTFFSLNILHETILIFQQAPKLVPPTREEWQSYLIQKNLLTEETKLPEDFIKKWAWSVWEMGVSQVKGHPAPYPLDLPLNLIKLYSFPQETVLDPFLGSGTTTLAAFQAQRNSVGYEINTSYFPVIQQQLGVGKLSKTGVGKIPSLIDDVNIVFQQRKNDQLIPFQGERLNDGSIAEKKYSRKESPSSLNTYFLPKANDANLSENKKQKKVSSSNLSAFFTSK